jgi:tetratricopeptide (TPR) repeat protein
MMTAANLIFSKQMRLATHYLNQLRSANRVYQRGGDHSIRSLKIIEQDWAQISQCQTWAVEQQTRDEQAAALCSSYPQAAGKLLDLILTPHEHRIWREAALAIARQINDQLAETGHLLALAQIHERLDLYPQAVEYTQQALALAQQLRHEEMIGQAALMLGMLEKDIGNYRDAAVHLEKGLAIFREQGNEEGIGKSLVELGEIANLRGAFAAAHDYFDEALRIYRHTDDRRGTATSLRCLASALYNQGNYETAKQYQDESLWLSRQIGDFWTVADVLIELGARTLGQPAMEEARQYSEESLQLYRKMGSLRGCAQSLLALATINSIQQNFQVALDFCEEGLAIYRQIGNRYGIANGLIILAYTYQGMENIAAVRKPLVEALYITQAIDATIFVPQILATMANQLLKTGEAERGAMLYGLAAASPLLQAYVREFAFPILLEWFQKTLPADVLEAAIARGQLLQIDDVFAQVLNEIE